jgi:hypothetical protein
MFRLAELVRRLDAHGEQDMWPGEVPSDLDGAEEHLSLDYVAGKHAILSDLGSDMHGCRRAFIVLGGGSAADRWPIADRVWDNICVVAYLVLLGKEKAGSNVENNEQAP